MMAASSNTVHDIRIDGQDNARVSAHVGNNINIYRAEDRCITDLRTTDPRDDKTRIEETKGGLLKGSYIWIIEHNDFRRWRDDEQCTLLWVKGNAGKGKTMLLCGIIDHLRPMTKLTDPELSPLLCFFFCQGTDSRINNATSVLCGLIYLLVEQQQCLLSHVRKKYDHAGKKLFEDENSWIALSEIFINILQALRSNTIYLVLDALDECEIGLPQLLDLIDQTSSLSKRIKWIVSSRNRPDIERKFRVDVSRLRLSLELKENAECVSQAVDTYIRHSVSELSSIQDDEILQQQVQEKMHEKANGTFLWVSLVVKELRDVESWEALDVIDEMPTDLKQVYARMMRQIQGLKRDQPTFCRMLLATITVAYRPLRLKELGTLSGLPKQISERLPSVTRIVELCSSFLTIRDGSVYIIHQSAKDFLIKDAFDAIFPDGDISVHRSMLSSSLDMLFEKLKRNMYGLSTLGPVDNPKIPDPDPLAVAGYSCVYWIDHACEATLNHLDILSGDGQVSEFLQTRFLYWLESLSLLRKLAEGSVSIRKLRREAESVNHTNTFLVSFLKDAERFISSFQSIFERAPLQIYGAALTFSPQTSEVKKRFWEQKFHQIPTAMGIREAWDSCLQILEGHHRPVTAVAFSPSGKHLASASSDWTIRIWDGDTGGYKKTLRGHSGYVLALEFSPNSRLLASGGSDRTVHLWNIEKNAIVYTFKGHKDWVNSVVFSPNGNLVASGSSDRTIRLWDITKGTHIEMPECHNGPVITLAFAPNGQVIASVSNDQTVRLWEVPSGNSLTCHSKSINAVAFSPDGQTLASASSDHIIQLWNLATGACKEFSGHRDSVNLVVFSGDGKTIVSASNDGSVQLWDVKSGTAEKLEGHRGWVNTAAFSPDGMVLVSGSSDCTIRLWDTSKISHVLEPNHHFACVNSVTFSSNGDSLASASSDTTVKVWDTRTGAYKHTLKGHVGQILDVTFSPDSSLLASASSDQTVRLWHTDGSISHILTGHSGYVLAVDFSPNGSLLASSASDWRIRLWDVSSGAHKDTFEGHRDWVRTIHFSPDGSILTSSSDDRTTRDWAVDPEALQQKPPVARIKTEGMPPDPNDSESCWTYLSPGIDRIISNPKGGLDLNTYMNMSSIIYRYCSTLRFTRIRNPDFATFSDIYGAIWANRRDLYMKLRDHINTHLEKLAIESQQYTEDALLAFYTREWSRFVLSANYIHHLFRLFDGDWISRERDQGRTVYSIKALHLIQWYRVFFLKISQMVVDATLRLIEEQRRGKDIDYGYIKLFLESLRLMGFSDDDESQTLEVYKEHFHTAFLEDTRRFYESETSELLKQKISVYMRKAQQRLDEEEERVRMYLHVNTAFPLKSICNELLIVKASSKFRAEFRDLLDNDCEEDMIRMFTLLSRVPETLQPILSDFEAYLQKAGLATIRDAGSESDKLDSKLFTGVVHSQRGKTHVRDWASPIESLEANTVSNSPGTDLKAPGKPLLDNDTDSLTIDENWVIQGAELLLWLPPDYRPTCAALYKNTLVFGHRSGRITHLKFPSSEP